MDNLKPWQYWLLAIVCCLGGITLIAYGIVGIIIHNIK